MQIVDRETSKESLLKEYSIMKRWEGDGILSPVCFLQNEHFCAMRSPLYNINVEDQLIFFNDDTSEDSSGERGERYYDHQTIILIGMQVIDRLEHIHKQGIKFG